MLMISLWNRNNIGGDLQLIPQLQQAPIQQKVSADSFLVTVKEKHYSVQPQYEYELYGLVVSYQLHDGNYGLHRRWGDHLNVADVCVIWQDSAFSEHLQKIDFWNGQFTCNVKTSSDEAWASFKMNQLSNNHLISEDTYMRDQISRVSIGDQIRISGWLSSYTNEHDGTRGTSITREDSGNGACETIYVNDFEIISTYTNPWRVLMYIASAILIVSLVFYFRQPFRVKQ